MRKFGLTAVVLAAFVGLVGCGGPADEVPKSAPPGGDRSKAEQPRQQPPGTDKPKPDGEKKDDKKEEGK